jgi:flagellar basal body-associated protein FliL
MVELAAGDAYAPTESLSTQVGSAFAPTQRVDAPPNLPSYGPDAVYVPPPPPLYPAPGVVIVQAPARQRSKKRLFFIVGGIVTALVVIVCACVGALLLIISSHSPEGVTRQYYSDVKSQNYADAYQLLTAPTQAQYDLAAQQNHLSSGQELFTKLSSCLDAQLGPVTAFTTNVLVQDKVHAIVHVSVTRSREQYTDTVNLFPENGGWAIMSPALPPNQHCA